MTQIEQISTDQNIFKSLEKLRNYIESENYKGWDPYDALNSPMFKLPFLKTNKFVRFGAQQFVKRFPFNLRPILRIPKGYNPVTLGLALQGYCYQIMKNEIPDQVRNDNLKKIEFLVDELERLQSKGYAGSCWGYDFDWEARHANIPAYKPTVVATGIITNALFICYKATRNDKAKKMLISSSQFVLNDLQRSYKNNNNAASTADEPFCFSYSPFDYQKVFNASMKGVRILAQVYSITKNESLIKTAKKAVEFVVANQNKDGSWNYSMAESGKFIDNYHTGYVLDCLDEYSSHSGDKDFETAIVKGFKFYRNNFFEEDGCPKFYFNNRYPVDCTAAAQSLLTLCRFGYPEKAVQVAKYMIINMQDEQGYFYFRDYGNKKDKTSFMRWSNSWMFASLTGLNYL